MGSLNKVMLIGNLGDDPKRNETQSGKIVCNFSLATNERVKGADGEWVDKAEWHRCVAWGKTAEAICEWLKKGSSAFIEGRLQTRKYEKEGVTHYATEVVVWNVQFLTKKAGADEVAPAARETHSSAGAGDDDIPF